LRKAGLLIAWVLAFGLGCAAFGPKQASRARALCSTRDEVEAQLTALARDEWRLLTTRVMTSRWPDLRAIGYDAGTKRPVMYERGLTEPTGMPRCVERYSFAAPRRSASRELVLNEVEVVHRETDREDSWSAASAFLRAIAPPPASGPSHRLVIDEGEIGKRLFKADHGWMRSADSVDANAREGVILDLREADGVFIIVMSWSRE
jgi:hypothetical protein